MLMSRKKPQLYSMDRIDMNEKKGNKEGKKESNRKLSFCMKTNRVECMKI